MSRDNASQRILSPRLVLRGREDSLENTLGRTLLNGAQCFVIGEQANYRFLKNSQLHADGVLVMAPIDGEGRWLRESSTVGIALLENGRVVTRDDVSIVTGYESEQLVQFAKNGDLLIYTGAASRVAMVFASANLDAPCDLVLAVADDKKLAPLSRKFEAPGFGSLVGSYPLVPGAQIALRTSSAVSGTGSLRIILT